MRTIELALCAVVLWPAIACALLHTEVSAEDPAVAQQEEEVVLIRAVSSQCLRPQAIIGDAMLRQQLWMPPGLLSAPLRPDLLLLARQAGVRSLDVAHQASFPLSALALRASDDSQHVVVFAIVLKLRKRASRECALFARSMTVLNVATLSSLLTSIPGQWLVIHPQMLTQSSQPMLYAEPSGSPLQHFTHGYPRSRDHQNVALRSHVTSSHRAGAGLRTAGVRWSCAAPWPVISRASLWNDAWVHWLQSRAPPR